MRSRWTWVGVVAPLALLGVLSLRATGASASDTTRPVAQDAEAVLKSKGLTRVGTYYVVDADTKFPDWLRALRKAERDMENYTRTRKAIERDIENAKSTLIQLDKDIADIDARLPNVPKSDPDQYNQLVGVANAKAAQVGVGVKYIQKRSGELSKLKAPGDIVPVTIDLADKMDAADDQYQKLAADSEVTAALAKVNERGGAKYRLGPSYAFKTELPDIRRKRDALNASALKLDLETNPGVARVNVALNGSTRVSMILDSGASMVILTSDVADRAGLRPGKDAPTGEVKIADGSKVKVVGATLATVQLGKYVAKNVECMIMPPSVNESDCLLGGSFLRNFIYRIDLASGELHLSPVTAETVQDSSAVAGGTTASAGHASAPPSASSTSQPDAPSVKVAEHEPSAPAVPTAASAPFILDFSADVDGVDDLRISALGLQMTHHEWNWPAHVTVNGIAWDP